MKKLFLLFISSIFVLSACGNKYDKEIEEVSKIEKQNWEENNNKDFNEFQREQADFKVYNGGKNVTVSYKAIKNSDTVGTDLFEKNESNGKFEEVSNVSVSKFQKNNKPDYEENNMKK
ncbi:TPA: cystatin-like fold lipoprotein [Staphylococcus aureus]|nr:cystatin-like fold lipoprotein [Staphylococcus aureus]